MRAKLMKKILSPVENFMALETSGGILLIICTIVAMTWANSPFSAAYHHFVHTPISFGFGAFIIQKSLLHWVNDGLMAIFFFVVGMEIKREMVSGELSTPKKAALPIFAAIGGMVAPALIYAAFNTEGFSARGWGIPMATDIAFAVGVLSLMGKRAPFSLKIFLLALAIVDDLGAVLVIALFYTEEISGSALAFTAGALFLTILLKKSGVRSLVVYAIFGFIAWFALLKSGVHATIAGVLLGLLTPAKPLHSVADLPEKIEGVTKNLISSVHLDVELQKLSSRSSSHMHQLHDLAIESQAPLDRLIHLLHPWLSFFIMPIFAIVNAGVTLAGSSLAMIVENSVSQGVILGLFLGKPLGVGLTCWLAVKFKIAQIPEGINWGHLVAAGCLAGVGFTMALFISGLAFNGDTSIEVFSKSGILIASALSSIAGCIILYINHSPQEA